MSTYLERLNKKKKENNSTYDTYLDRQEAQNIRNGKDTLFSDYQNLINSHNSTIQDTQKYSDVKDYNSGINYGNRDSLHNSINTDYNNYQNISDRLKKFRNEYVNMYGEDNVKTLEEGLSSIGDNIHNVSSGIENLNSYWDSVKKNFKTEDEYKQYQDISALKSMSNDEIMNALKNNGKYTYFNGDPNNESWVQESKVNNPKNIEDYISNYGDTNLLKQYRDYLLEGEEKTGTYLPYRNTIQTSTGTQMSLLPNYTNNTGAGSAVERGEKTYKYKDIDEEKINLLNSKIKIKESEKKFEDEYNKYSKADDWEEYSRNNINSLNGYDINNSIHNSNSYSADGIYNFINLKKEYQDLSPNLHSPNNDSELMKFQSMSDDEIKTYNYIYQKYGEEKALKYIDDITPVLNYRMTSKTEENATKFASEHPVLGSIASVGTNILSAVNGKPVGNAIKSAITGEEIDTNGSEYLAQRATNAIRNQVASDIDSDVGKHIYQISSSVVDNAIRIAMATALTGGVGAVGEAVGSSALASAPKYTAEVTSALMGNSVATNAIIEGKEKGYSDVKALTLGIIQGAIEGVTEKYSIDRIIKNPNLLKSAVTEGTEEVASNWMNNIVDAVANGDKSEFNQFIKAYKEENPDATDGKAFSMAILNSLKDDGLAFLGGAIAGGAMAGTQQGINYVGNSLTGKDIKNLDNVNTLVEIGSNLDTNSKAYKTANKISEKISNNKSVSNNLVGKLRNEIINETQQASNADLSTAIENRLVTLGEKSAKAQYLSNVAVKVINGESLSTAEKVALGGSTQVQRVISEYNNSDKSNYTNEWSNNIQSKARTFNAMAQFSDKSSLSSADVSKANVPIVGVNSVNNGDVTYNLSNGKIAKANELKLTNGYDVINNYAKSMNTEEANNYVAGYKELSADVNPETYNALWTIAKEAGINDNQQMLQDVANREDNVLSSKSLLNAFKAGVTEGAKTKSNGDVIKQAEPIKVDKNIKSESNRETVYNEYAPQHIDDISTYENMFNRVYTAGTRGVTYKSLSNNINYADVMRELGETEIKDILSAGKNDYNSTLKNENVTNREKKKGEVKVSKEVYNKLFSNAKTDEDYDKILHIDTLNSIAETLGTDIVVEDIEDNNINGYIKNGVIHINVNKTTEGILFTATHESVHFLRMNNEKGYRALRDFVFDCLTDKGVNIDSRVSNVIDTYLEKNALDINNLTDGAEEEIIANAFGSIIGNEQAMQKAYSLSTEKKNAIISAIRNIIDRLKSFLKSLTNMSEVKALKNDINAQVKMAEIFADGLEKSNVQQSGQKNNTTDGAKHSINPDFSEEVERAYKDGTIKNKTFILGETSDILQALGARENSIYMNGDKIITILSEHPEMSIDTIKNIPKLIDNPVLILRSKNKVDNNSRVVLFGRYNAENGKPMLAVIDLMPKEDKLVINNMQKLVSSYSKTKNINKNTNFEDEIKYFFEHSEVMYVTENKKIAKNLIGRVGFVMPTELRHFGYVGNISYEKRKVKLTGMPFTEVFSYDEKGAKLSIDELGETLPGTKFSIYESGGENKTSESNSNGDTLSNEMISKLENHFGTTDNYNVAGYLLTDGKMLDFSGKHWGGSVTQREVEHYDILEGFEDEEVYDELEDGYDAQLYTLRNGNIRLMPEIGGINLSTKPNKLQLFTLRGYIDNFGGDVYVEVTDNNEKQLYSKHYSKGTSSQVILNDIDNYFVNNVTPNTELSYKDFRYSIDGDMTMTPEMMSEVETEKALEQTNNLTAKLLKQLFNDNKVTKSSFIKSAEEVLSKYESTMSANSYAEAMWSLAGFARNNDNVTPTDLMTQMSQISNSAVDKTKKIIDPFEEERKEIRGQLKGRTLLLTDRQVQMLDFGMGTNRYKQLMFGTTTIKKAENHGSSIAGGIDRQGGKTCYLSEMYYDLQDQFGYALFPEIQEDMMPEELLRVLETLKPTVDTVDGANRYDMSMAMTQDFIVALCSEVQNSTNSKLKQKYDKAIKELKDSQKEWKEKYREEYNNRLNRKLKEQKEKDAVRFNKRLNARDKKILEIKAKQRDKQSKRRDAMLSRELMRKIQRKCKKFGDMLSNKQKTAKIPVELIKEISNLANVIDGGVTKNGNKVAGYNSFYRMSELYERISKYPEKVDKGYVLEYSTKIRDDINEIGEMLNGRAINEITSPQELEKIYNVLKEIEHNLKSANELLVEGRRIDYVTAGEHDIKAIEKLRGRNKKNGGISAWKNNLEKFVNFNNDPMRTIRFITGYDEDTTLYKCAKELDKATSKKYELLKKGREYFADISKSNVKRMETFDGKKADFRDFGLHDIRTGETVRITDAQAISIYMSSQNEDNRRHFMIKTDETGKRTTHKCGGMNIPDERYYKKGEYDKAREHSHRVILSEDSLAKIKSHIENDEFLKNFANKTYDFFNVFSTQLFDEVSMALHNVPGSIKGTYFPIDVNKSYIKTEFENLVLDGKLENTGITKDRVHSSAPIWISDVTDVINKHLDTIASLNAFAVPLRNFEKIYNYTSSGYGNSVKAQIEYTWGKSATKYIENFIVDLNVQSTGANIKNNKTEFSKVFSKFRSYFAQSVLATNLSVIFKQTASFYVAIAKLGIKPVMKSFVMQEHKDGIKYGIVRRAEQSEIDSITPLVAERRNGLGYNPVTGKGVNSLLDLSKDQPWAKKLPYIMDAIQRMDIATVNRLFYASKFYMKKNYSEINEGTDEYKEKLKEVYEDVINYTQPQYSTMHRPQALRTENELIKSVTMFMTQRLQNFGIVFDATGDFIAKKRELKLNSTTDNIKAYKRAKVNLINGIVGVGVSAIVIAVMQFLYRALSGNLDRYRDDEEEITAEAIAKRIGIDTIESLFSNVFLGAELFSEIENIVNSVDGKSTFYETDLLDVNIISAVNDFVGNINDVISSTVQFSTYSNWTKDKIDKNIKNICESTYGIVSGVLKYKFGVPVDNLKKHFESVYNHASDFVNGQMLSFRTGSNAELNSSDYCELIYDSLIDGDKEKAAQLWDKAISNGKSETSLNTALKNILVDDETIYQCAVAKNDGLDYSGKKSVLTNLGFPEKIIDKAIEYIVDNILNVKEEKTKKEAIINPFR